MEYVAAGGPVVNSPNVDKGITVLAINMNLNSYIENIINTTNISQLFKITLET